MIKLTKENIFKISNSFHNAFKQKRKKINLFSNKKKTPLKLKYNLLFNMTIILVCMPALYRESEDYFKCKNKNIQVL